MNCPGLRGWPPAVAPLGTVCSVAYPAPPSDALIMATIWFKESADVQTMGGVALLPWTLMTRVPVAVGAGLAKRAAWPAMGWVGSMGVPAFNSMPPEPGVGLKVSISLYIFSVVIALWTVARLPG